MKSINPDGLRGRVPGFRTFRQGATLLALAVAFAIPAGAGTPPAPSADPCAAARDRALAALAEDALAIAIAFDNDAALADASVYTLEEEKKALLDDIERMRHAAEDRYRRCRSGR